MNMKPVFLVALALIAFVVCDQANWNPPTQMHLALTGDPTEMVVSWMTSFPTKDSIVKVYSESGSHIGTFEGEQSSYHPSAGWVHHTIVNGLKPNTNYTYRCGTSDGGYTTMDLNFNTAPPLGDRGNKTFVFYGDMGIFEYAYYTIKHLTGLSKSKKIDLIYHAGDFSYGNNRPAEYYEMSWDIFFDQLQLVMPYVPYMTTPGNHETTCSHSQCDYYAKNFTVYNSRFRMPGKESGTNNNMWFSFNYGNVHFVSISTETDYPNCPTTYTYGNQISWLEKDLAKASTDSTVDWIFVHGHRPVYSSIVGKSTDGIPTGDTRNVQLAFEDIFYRYGVDIYFDGHVHGYERSYPVYQSKVVGNSTLNSYVNPEATVYIVNGNAGNIEGFYDDWDPIIPKWSAKRFWPQPVHGLGVLETFGSTKLKWTWYKNSESDVPDADDVFDWFELQKSP